MIIFVDGIDGSGKTALIRHLATALNSSGIEAVVSSPLWRYLPTIAAPEQFASWAVSTAGMNVAEALIGAMIDRLDDLRDLSVAQDPVYLVDRGPKTVYASARAHAHERHTAFELLWENLAASVRALTDVQPSVAIELGEGEEALQTALARLTSSQTVTPGYLGICKHSPPRCILLATGRACQQSDLTFPCRPNPIAWRSSSHSASRRSRTAVRT